MGWVAGEIKNKLAVEVELGNDNKNIIPKKVGGYGQVMKSTLILYEKGPLTCQYRTKLNNTVHVHYDLH